MDIRCLSYPESRDIASALSMCPGIRKQHAVATLQEHAGISTHARPVVGDSMQQDYRASIARLRLHIPARKPDSVGGSNLNICGLPTRLSSDLPHLLTFIRADRELGTMKSELCKRNSNQCAERKIQKNEYHGSTAEPTDCLRAEHSVSEDTVGRRSLFHSSAFLGGSVSPW